MANLVFTSEGAGYKVVSNDVPTRWSTYYLLPGDIIEAYENDDSTAVSLVLSSGVVWELTLTSNAGEWKVDTILGEVAADISALSLLVSKLRIRSARLDATGIDANNIASVTPSLDLGDGMNVSMYVIEDTGDHDNHVVTLQVSPDDGTTWFDTTHSVIKTGFVHDEICVGTSIRGSVSTAEGALSTVDIILIVK